MRRWLLAAGVAAAVVWGAPGCGGGGGGPTAPPPPRPGITFTPGGSAGEQTIHLTGVTTSDPMVLRLEVRASMVTDLYGLGFDFDYPETLVGWNASGSVEGDFLNADGTTTEFQIRERPAGTLIVGLSRLGPVAGVDGSGVLMTLEFNALANGTDSMVFAAEGAFDSAGDRLRDTAWIAGDIRVILQ